MSFHVDKVDLQDIKERYDALLQEQDQDIAQQRITQLLQILVDTAKTLPDMLDKWEAQASSIGLDDVDLPQSVYEYIDDYLIDIPRDNTLAEVLQLFSKEPLKSIYKKNGELDQDALIAWEKSTVEKEKYRLARTQASRATIDDDAF